MKQRKRCDDIQIEANFTYGVMRVLTRRPWYLGGGANITELPLQEGDDLAYQLNAALKAIKSL